MYNDDDYDGALKTMVRGTPSRWHYLRKGKHSKFVNNPLVRNLYWKKCTYYVIIRDIEETEKIQYDIYKWLCSNTTGRFMYKKNWGILKDTDDDKILLAKNSLPWLKDNLVVIFFEKHDDATAFKMTWG